MATRNVGSRGFLKRDPISGTAYYASFLLFAGMPAIITRFRQTYTLEGQIRTAGGAGPMRRGP
jgi:hypothetical protein